MKETRSIHLKNKKFPLEWQTKSVHINDKTEENEDSRQGSRQVKKDLSFSHSLFGFSDWKHIGPCLESHEDSSKNKKSLLVWLTRKKNKSVIEKELQEQLKTDTEYYHNVLKCVVAVVKYLSVRGLAFRGHKEIFSSAHNDLSEYP
ncbi:hypothetical protein ILUMI_05829, partial [Ignelater luminosus]